MDNGKYEVRGEVSQLVSPGNFSINTWDSTNFGGFWYDIDENRQTEKLNILKFKDNRTIDKDNIQYITTRAPQKYKVFKEKGSNFTIEDGLDSKLNKPSSPARGGYYALVGWMAEKYIAVNGKNNKLAKLILEQDITDRQTLHVGEVWVLGEGYTLTARSIDAKAAPRQAWLVLSKDGNDLDDKVIEQGSIYTYSTDLVGEKDVPVFVTYIDRILTDQYSDMVQLKYTWFVSTKVIDVRTGDRVGIFYVDTEQPLVLENNEKIYLSRCSIIDLANNMKFKVADSEDNDVRFYPIIEKEVHMPDKNIVKLIDSSIFIIHGHDETTLSNLKNVLYDIGIKRPITFNDLPKYGSVTNIELLEENIPNFGAIIALLTPDDEGRKRLTPDDEGRKRLTPDDEGRKMEEYELKPRARENVMIEAGYAIISKRQRSLIIAIGGVSIPTDFDGIHRVQGKEWSHEIKTKVAKRIKDMGFDIDISKAI